MGVLLVSIRTSDAGLIRPGLKLPVSVSDGELESEWRVQIDKCSCNGPDDQAMCDLITAGVAKPQV